MNRPYIDKSINESEKEEYSIHGLSKIDIQILLEGLDWISAALPLVNKKKVALNLASSLNDSYKNVE